MSKVTFVIDPYLSAQEVVNALELFAVPNEEIQTGELTINVTVEEEFVQHFMFDLGRVFAYLILRTNVNRVSGVSSMVQSGDAPSGDVLPRMHSILNPFDWWQDGRKQEGHATEGNVFLENGEHKPQGQGHEAEGIDAPEKPMKIQRSA